MFRTKKDVDRHVQELFRKVKGENERKYKYFNIARLYYQVGDYESSRRYVSSFLSIRDDSASAHKLLGHALEALGQKEAALAEYKCSLMLENNQSELVLKVCELMADNDTPLDESTARYWCNRAEQLFPHHHLIFKLKEKLVSANKDSNAAELESLITSEMSARPKDVCLHIKLIQLYLEKGRVKDAYKMAVDVEMRSVFRDDLKWYECISEVLKNYEETVKTCGWEFYMHYMCTLERAVCLNLQEQYGSLRRTWVQGVQALFNLDQMLETASNQSPPSSEVEMYQELLKHQRAQLCLHLATALFKKAKREPGSWRDVVRAASPLLLLALVPPIDLHGSWLAQATELRRRIVKWWAREAAYRNSQAGHIIVSLVSELRSQFLERVAQFCAGSWRERLFQKIFNTRDHQQAMGSSHFVCFQGFSCPQLQIPSPLELKPHDEMSQMLHPNSLHHLVWLGLRELSTSWGKQGGVARLGSEFRCLVFEDLQFTCSNPNSAGSETLCQLDIDAFLYASVLCAKASLEEEQTAGYRGNDRPQILPANITDQLCTVAQSKWWAAAYRVYLNQARSDLGEVRQTLQRGVEVMRVLGNHGLDVRLIVQLARIFSERALAMAGRSDNSADLPAVEGRAAMYWTCALPLLDRLQRNQTVRAPHARLFEYQGKELSMAEINMLLEEGRYFLACQLMKEDKHEKAIESFQQLKSPYASFHQAMIYKKLAAMELQEQQVELISETQSRHVILLTKARECLYLTLDRLRSPGADRKHPLNAELSAHIEEIESQLARIDPDVWRGDVNRNDLEDISDGSASSPSGGENGNSLYGLGSSYMHTSSRHFHARLSSTPYHSGHNHRNDSDLTGHEHSRRTEARPSPERLEAQIRQLTHGRDSQMQHLVQHNKAVLDLLKNVAETQNKLVRSVDELKNIMQDMMKKDSHKRSESQMNSDLPHVGDADDDLYVFDDDYSEDVSISANHVGQYQPFPQYPSYANPNYRQLPSLLASSTVPYGPAAAAADSSGVPPPQLLPPAAGMSNFFRNVDPSLIYPQTLSYYGQGALPFSEGQQLPDFRATAPVPPAPVGSVFSRLGPSVAAAALAAGPAGDASKLTHPQAQAAPVNVVITSSDTLPTTVPPTQPTLSVTIPPQHRLGTSLAHVAGPPPVGPGLPPTGVPPVQVMPTGIPPGGMGFPGIQQAQLQSQLSLGTPLSASTTSTSVPHAFQISMPPQAQVPEASRLEQGAAALSPILPISTQTLLSSVPSPVYSAVGLDKTSKDQSGVSIGLAGAPATPKATKAHRVSTGSVAESEEGTEEPEQDPCPDFQPVIPLPAEVELTTGEEEEASLFECRCKLFRFVDKEWKERGVGVLKILHHKETGKVRILMRREQVLKVCANHFLASDMALTRMTEKAWIWVANDFADEQVRLEKLCARFKTVDDSENFADSFREGCELSKKAKTTPLKDTCKKSGVKSPASSILTSTSTTNKPSASTLASTPTVTSSADSSMSSVASTSPSEKIVLGGFTFIAPPKFTVSSQKTVAEKDTTKEKEKSGSTTPKPSPFAMFSFNTSTSKGTSSDLSGTNKAAGPGPKPISFVPASTNTNAAPAGDSSVRSGKSIAPGFRDTSGGGDVWLDKATTNLPTFSLLASSSSVPVFKKDSSFQGFEGAGSLLFKSSGSQDKTKTPSRVSVGSSGRTDGGRGGGEEESEEFEPTCEFAPVVPLPEVVEVRTGEEDEVLVFKERAKLLRFDSDGKQWKERGVGQMKIFKDPSTGRVRLIMRREQVLKVCCNHQLTACMAFNSMQTSDRAWTWIAQDFSDGEMKPELLAIRFKTSEQALAFKNAITDIQSQMIDDKLPVEISQSSVASSMSVVDTKVTTAATSISMSLATSVLSPTAHTVGQPKRMPDKQIAEVWKCDWCLFPNGADDRTCKSCESLKPEVSKPLNLAQKTDAKPKLSELFKPTPGSWTCSACLVQNAAEDVICVCCKQSRTDKGASRAVSNKAANTSPNRPFSELFKPKPGSWECKGCYVRNEGTRMQCLACSTTRSGCEEAVKEKEKAELGIAGSWTCSACLVQNAAEDVICVCCKQSRTDKGASQAASNKAANTSPNKPLSELFKPKPGSWECKGCYVRNEGTRMQCPACSTIRPGCEEAVKEKEKAELGIAGNTFGLSGNLQSSGFIFGMPKQSDEAKEKVETATPSGFGGFSFGVSPTPTTALGSTWTFGTSTPTSTASTFGSLPVSSSSEKLQPVSPSISGVKSEPHKPFSFEIKASGSTPFQFGTISTPSKPFSFGSIGNKDDQENVPQEPGPRNFVFGSPQKFEFNFSGVRPKSPVKSPKSPGVAGVSGGEDDSGSEPDEDEGEHIYFQPVVPLPDKVPVHTGEELEEVLYSHRAKLFRFIDGVWKERGVGDVKILKHKETHKVRLVMRREQVLKLCMNHFLTRDISFCEKDEKSWLWCAPDFSEGQITQERFAIRFQNKEVASAFKVAADEAMINWGSPSNAGETSKKEDASDVSQEKQQGPDGGSLSEAVKNLTFSGGIESQNISSKGVVRALFKEGSTSASEDAASGDGEVEVVYEFAVTPEEQGEAKRLQLPPNFFAYRLKTPCPGCCGCEPDSDPEEATDAPASSLSTNIIASSASVIATGSTATDNSVVSSSEPASSKFSLSPPHFSASLPTPAVSSSSSLSSAVSGQTSAQSGTFLFKPPSSTSSSTATISFGQSLTSSLNGQLKTPELPSTNTRHQQEKESNNVFSQQTPVSNISTQPTSTFAGFSFSPSKNKDIKPLFGQGAEIKNAEKKQTATFGHSADTPFFGTASTKVPIFGGSATTTFATPIFGSSAQTNAVTATSTADSPKPPFSFITRSTSDKPFTFTLSSAAETKPFDAEGAATKESSAEGPAYLSSVDSDLSFGSIASNSKKAPTFATGSQFDTAFTWAGAGTQVFRGTSSKKVDTPKSSTPKATGDEGSDEDSGGEAEDSHDPHFEPIIALPDTIEVRTGEEEEVKLFCQRAKLYRFDDGEWKERGVGEMKVLKHPTRGTYRLLLRREQVHKVVLNQLIIPSIDIGPSSYSDVTWIWAGLNFAWDESTGEVCTEPRLEKLAVRFKSRDLALDFRDCVDQCLAELSARASAPPSEITPVPESVPAVVPGTNPPQIAKADSTAEGTDDEKFEDGEEEDDEDEDNESDRNLLFEKRATLEVSSPGKESWELLGMGVLQVFYDNDYFIARIYMEADTSGDILCNTFIAMNTELEVKSKDCIWTAKDYSSEPNIFRKFKARFSSETAAEEFRNVFSEGKEIAMQCDMIENMDPSELVEA